jgi:hypothetical protein
MNKPVIFSLMVPWACESCLGYATKLCALENKPVHVIISGNMV